MPETFAVMLTFDLDAESILVYEDPNNVGRPGVLSQAQYGPRVAVYRILRLMQQYNLPCTFFIPGWVIERYPAAAQAVHAAGCEIGHHGYTHQTPASLEPEVEREHMERSIELIRRITGRTPAGYRSPAWDFSPATLPLLARYGFLYSSNMMDADGPYVHSIGDRKLVELPVQWVLDDAPFFMYRPPYRRPIQPPSVPYEYWTEEFEGLYEEHMLLGERKCFVLTMHPQIIGRPGRMRMLERFIQFVLRHKNVRFFRCEDFARTLL